MTRTAAPRWTLVLPEVVPADRVTVADLLGAADGTVRTISLARRSGPGRRSLPDLDETILVATGGLGATAPTPVRLATFRSAGSGANSGEVSVILGPLVTYGSLDLPRSYMTRDGAVATGLRPGAVPLSAAEDPAAVWSRIATDIAAAYPGGYDDLCFLRVVRAAPDVVEIQCQMASGALPSDGTVSLVDAKDRGIDTVPIAALVRLPVGSSSPVRAEVRSSSAQGRVGLPPIVIRSIEADAAAPPRIQVVAASPWVSNVAFEIIDFVGGAFKTSAQQRAELASLLARADPSNAELRFHEARAWLEAGNPGAVRRAIESVDAAQRSAGAEAMLIVAELEEGRLDESDDRYLRATFDGDLFTRLTKAVSALEPATRTRAVAYLVRVLDTSRAAALAAENKGSIPAGADLLTIANRLADHAPGDAVTMLESAGTLEQLDTPSLQLILSVRERQGDRKIGDALALLTSRLLADGQLGAAIDLLERFRDRLTWADLLDLAEVFTSRIASMGSGWDEDREFDAIRVAQLASQSIREQMVADLPEALESIGRLRSAFGTDSPYVNEVLDDLGRSLEDAWESSEPYRVALETVADQLEPRIRERWNGKRLLVVGGRKPVWYQEAQGKVGFSDKSEWISSSPGKRPSHELLKRKISSGKLDLLVIVVDYIAHATSDVRQFAEAQGIPVADARSGRYSFLKALEGVR